MLLQKVSCICGVFRNPVLILLFLALFGSGCSGKPTTEVSPESLIGEFSGNPCSLETVVRGDPTLADTVIWDPPSPCRVIASLAVVLRGSPDGSWPDPAPSMVAQDSRGRFYTGSGWQRGQGQVLVWRPDGTPLGSVGRLGQGPGEFPKGQLDVFVGGLDSVYVFSYLRLTVFTPDYTLVRVDANPVVGFSPVNQTRYVFPGQFLSVGRVIGQPNESRFHLASTTGEHLRSFGRILSQTEEHEGNTPGRVPLLAYFAGDTFWSVVETGMESAYVLEQWKLDGTLVQRLRRNADWWDNRERRRSILRVIRLHIDMEGRIWILMASTTDPENRTKLRFRYDVVSPRNGIVLASGSFPETRIDSDSLDYYPPILEFIQGTSRSWRPALDPETGIPSLQVFDLFLQGGY